MRPKLPERAELPLSMWPTHTVTLNERLSVWDVRLKCSRIGTVVAVDAHRVTLEFEA